MKVCIVYDTKRERGATKHIVSWMEEGLKANSIQVDVKRVMEVENFNYDLFIIGSPIYWERPMKSVLNFLDTNRENFRNKRVAIFIVCMAQLFGKHTEKYIRNRYLKPLEEKLSGSLVKKGIFKGWLKKPNYAQAKMIKDWTIDLAK